MFMDKVVDSGQASLSYTLRRELPLDAHVVDSGQASTELYFDFPPISMAAGCGQRAGVTELY